MQRLLNKTIIFLLMLLVFPIANADAEIFTFNTGEVKGAYRDLMVTKIDDEYFLHKEDLLPGDVIKGAYEITNTSSKVYQLTLKSLINENSPSSEMIDKEGKRIDSDWIKDINLKLKLDNEVIYNGPADGSEQFTSYADTEDNTKFTDGIIIGLISKGDKRLLEAEFTIPETFANDYMEAWARVDWIFSARWNSGGGGGGGTTPTPNPKPKPKPKPDPIPDPTPSLDPEPTPTPLPDDIPPLPAPAEIPDEPFNTPDTGDSIASLVIYVIIILGAISGILLVLFSKKKEQE